MKKILAVIAHPDDESFGIGGTLAKYAQEGVEIHVLCATRGENGRGGSDLGKIREQELMNASKIIGVERVEFMGFIDGMLSNSLYHKMAEKITQKIINFKPQVVLTFDRLGVSGHIDHIMVAMVTTFVCQKIKDQVTLFYMCELKETTDLELNYFIYFPPGYRKSDMDVVIDIHHVWKTKVNAMLSHKSQAKDAQWIIKYKKDQPKEEYFLKGFTEKNQHNHQTTDFFSA